MIGTIRPRFRGVDPWPPLDQWLREQPQEAALIEDRLGRPVTHWGMVIGPEATLGSSFAICIRQESFAGEQDHLVATVSMHDRYRAVAKRYGLKTFADLHALVAGLVRDAGHLNDLGLLDPLDHDEASWVMRIVGSRPGPSTVGRLLARLLRGAQARNRFLRDPAFLAIAPMLDAAHTRENLAEALVAVRDLRHHLAGLEETPFGPDLPATTRHNRLKALEIALDDCTHDWTMTGAPDWSKPLGAFIAAVRPDHVRTGEAGVISRGGHQRMDPRAFKLMVLSGPELPASIRREKP